MTFVESTHPDQGIADLTKHLIHALKAGTPTLWLIPGGSNVPIAVEVMKRLRAGKTPLSSLTISLTDERYGIVGHADSNWQQLIQAGFDFSGATVVPVLKGLPMDATAVEFGAAIESAIAHCREVVGQFGIGADGHIAGVLPHSPAVHAATPAHAYKAGAYDRVTLTPRTLKKLTAAFVFVYGKEKRRAMTDLRDKNLPLDTEPAQLLKAIPAVQIYTDSLL